MFTYSGIRVTPDGDAAPALEDIVRGLAAAQRFAGQGQESYSVLQHSLACYYVAATLNGGYLDLLFCLLHDAHEAVTGDVPTDWKPMELGMMQKKLDRRIRQSLNAPEPEQQHTAFVERVDRDVLMAEGQLVGPSRFTEWSGFVKPSLEALTIVNMVRSWEPDAQARAFHGALRGCIARTTKQN